MGELKLFRKRFDEEVTCGGCKQKTRNLYVLAKDENDARDLIEMGEGLCADCTLDNVVRELS